jgi:hypothetical protein
MGDSSMNSALDALHSGGGFAPILVLIIAALVVGAIINR